MTLNDAFAQQVALLAMGALITGFGVPYVLRLIDSRKLREQKAFEADLARQSKLLDAQSALLDEMTRIVWAWRYLAKRVVYYGARGDKELNALCKCRDHDVDTKVSEVASGSDIDRVGCSELAARFSDEVSRSLDDALFELAAELRLTSRSVEGTEVRPASMGRPRRASPQRV